MNTSRTRKAGLLTVLAAAAIGIAVAAPTAAVAAPAAPTMVAPAADGDTGWLRLGHLSPDTAKVDVRVDALRGGSTLLELKSVGYGDVSPYQQVPNGTYTVSMVAAGSDDWKTPVISATVTVDAGTASTVAAYGPNTKLQVRAFRDDLAAPAAGNARIRVIQASTKTPTVDVQTSTGVPIAKGARPGSATNYAEVPGGSWTLQLKGTNVSDTANVDVAAGSVTTLFVLDTADGGLTILPVLDSAAAAVVPGGGVQTGGGWLAEHRAAHLGHTAVID